MKNQFTLFVLLLVLASFVFTTPNVIASNNGYTGRTLKTSTTGCGSCHALSSNITGLLTTGGSDTVYAGQTYTFSLTITTVSASGNYGVDIAAKTGILGLISGQGLKLSNGELTHSSPLTYSSPKVITFSYTAPSAAGTDTVYATIDRGHTGIYNFVPNKGVTVIIPDNDVGTNSIDINDISPGSFTPKATVKNIGLNTQTFPVTMVINPGGYTSTQTVTGLASGLTQQVSFMNHPGLIGSYNVTVYTQLGTDANKLNDTLRKSFNITAGQTTVFADNFSTETNSAYTYGGQINMSAFFVTKHWRPTWAARRDPTTQMLEINNNTGGAPSLASGWVFAYTPLSGFSSPYNRTLNLNPGMVTWTFNMRTNRSTANDGFGSYSDSISERYGMALILSATEDSADHKGNGYAVIQGNRPTNGNALSFIRYSGGLRGTKTTIEDFGPPPAATRDWFSVKVNYTPATNTWQFFYRDDGSYTSPPQDPETGTLSQIGTSVVDNAYTSTQMTYMGAYWQGDMTSGRTAHFDNLKVKVSIPTGNTQISSEIPSEFKLHDNFPNPFNPSTTIKYDIPKSSFVKLAVYDITGKEVALLVNNNLQAGKYEVKWNGANQSSGVYFVRIEAGSFSRNVRMVLVK
jgi:hypothetical protein